MIIHSFTLKSTLKSLIAAAALLAITPDPVGQAAFAQDGPHAAATRHTSEIDISTDLDLVRESLNAWLAAFNAKDIDALMALYDAESSYANANAPLLTDLETIRARYGEGFNVLTGTLRFKEEKAFATGGMGLIVGKYFFEPPAGEPVTGGSTGRVALVFRKDANGAWKLFFDMDNTPPDVTPADFD